MKQYIYIDYENMGNLKELIHVEGKYFIFVGKLQNMIPKSLVLATNKISVEWIPIEGTGKNALDFHIAYYLGLQIQNTDDIHYILSKDQGYDPLIATINKKYGKKLVKRIISLDELKQKEKVTDVSSENDYKTLLTKLKEMQKIRRPKSEKTLISFIRTQVFKDLPEDKTRKLLNELYRNKVISKGNNQRITYN